MLHAHVQHASGPWNGRDPWQRPPCPRAGALPPSHTAPIMIPRPSGVRAEGRASTGRLPAPPRQRLKRFERLERCPTIAEALVASWLSIFVGAQGCGGEGGVGTRGRHRAPARCCHPTPFFFFAEDHDHHCASRRDGDPCVPVILSVPPSNGSVLVWRGRPCPPPPTGRAHCTRGLVSRSQMSLGRLHGVSRFTK